MERINEAMVKKLAYEERLCLYRLAQKNELSSEEIPGVLHMVEALTEINLNSKNFDFKSMSVLGIDNCCNFFKILCQQYSDLITNSIKDADADTIANQKRMEIVIGSSYQGVKPRIIDIGLYDAAKIVDGIEEKNCVELFNGSMKGQDLQQVNTYAMFSTFADMYYAIRDLIEGKTYYDGQFMTEYRELPVEYEKESQGLIDAFMQRSKVSSKDIAKEQLLTTLNEGVSELRNMLSSITKKEESSDYYEKLKEDYYKEHGYPQQPVQEEPKRDVTTEEYIEELRESYYKEHGTPENTGRHM